MSSPITTERRTSRMNEVKHGANPPQDARPFSNIPDGMRCHEIAHKIYDLFIAENLRQDQALVILDHVKFEMAQMKVN